MGRGRNWPVPVIHGTYCSHVITFIWRPRDCEDPVTTSETLYFWFRRLWSLEPFIHSFTKTTTTTSLSIDFVPDAVLHGGTR